MANQNSSPPIQLFESRRKVFPQKIDGTFRRLKWLVMIIALGVYYTLPWLRWDRGPNAPDQAVLLDLEAKRFYFFFIELWPNEIYFVTGLMIAGAVSLFLINALFGRVWCGYACPQTVWTDLFVHIERLVEGDRNKQIRNDRSAWSINKITKKFVKHSAWILVAILTGGAWVFYFADAPTLFWDLVTGQASYIAYIWIGLLTCTTYLLGGIAREQVCTYMCPWPRIQAAMTDEDALNVTYRYDRGEPRGAHKKGTSWDNRGDCVDCNLCVSVCPMGIDIRNGTQLECIHCALCIDACSSIMDKIGRPTGLIAYDTEANIERRINKEQTGWRPLRPRVLVYAAVLAVVFIAMGSAYFSRKSLDLAVQRDRNPNFVVLSDGSIRNGYTIKVSNKTLEDQHYFLTLEGLSGHGFLEVGSQDNDIEAIHLVVPGNELLSTRVYVAAPSSNVKSHSMPISFVLTEQWGGPKYRVNDFFKGPDL